MIADDSTGFCNNYTQTVGSQWRRYQVVKAWVEGDMGAFDKYDTLNLTCRG